MRCTISWCLPLILIQSVVLSAAEPTGESASFSRGVMADSPVLYWDMETDPTKTPSRGEAQLQAQGVGQLQWPAPGPAADRYPVFPNARHAVSMPEHRGYLTIDDPGANSVLDFDNGDALTIETWIQVQSIGEGRHVYILGKGRTNNPGFAADNQNYALRLTGRQGSGCPSFLFRSRGEGAEFHRWTADSGVRTGGSWHHIAVTYRFGASESLRCVVDGRPMTGKWDMGGPTERPPVVDNDQLWIGSSIGGNTNCTLHGSIGDLAIYRKEISVERLVSRFAKSVTPLDWQAKFKRAPVGKVAVEVYENAPARVPDLDEPFESPPRSTFLKDWFAASALPRTYVSGGVRGKMAGAQCVQMRGRWLVDSPQAFELLVRTRSGSKLWIDGELVAEVPMMKRNSSGHEAVPALAEQEGELAMLSAGHQERRATVTLEPGEHLVQWNLIAGGKGVRTELGEAYIGVRTLDENANPASAEVFRLLTGDGLAEPITESFRSEMLERLREENVGRDTAARRLAAKADDPYWRKRHEQAEEIADAMAPNVPAPLPGYPANNAIDHFLNPKLKSAGIAPKDLRLVDSHAFLRRVTLDITGVIPTADELTTFSADSVEGRRDRAIQRLLVDPRWADHWVSYWQDVLAENPGILKPKLNNTGPFRFWVHESFLDNKPLDRFATELIRMRGGVYEGGAAAFAIATQNDVPMAAKAHVIATAFLGVEMKCARCHDAPYHPYQQAELMGLAAYLERKPIKLPASSTVPVNPGGREPLIQISLKPGATIQPQWPFDEWVSPEQVQPTLPPGADAREELAALVTSPHNLRFAEVAVNRIWHRYFGRGLMSDLGDWHEAETQHEDLLKYLATELLRSGYDVKHIAGLILNSHAYQRQLQPHGVQDQGPQGWGDDHLALFAAPTRRRMSAEQLLDSLLSAAGKPMDTEALTLDPEGRRDSSTFLNLGEPRRAWEFTSLSNERDRPALALPAAQSMVDLLVAFGWRDSRPDPMSVRSDEPTVRQPLALANGLASLKATRLSDDHAVTEMALAETELAHLVRQVYLQLLSREPTAAEAARFEDLLQVGFAERRVIGAKRRPRERLRNPVSWSNHLNREATRIKLELQERVRQGDPPTQRLTADWRERLEDMVWALVNSPEFLFIP